MSKRVSEADSGLSRLNLLPRGSPRALPRSSRGEGLAGQKSSSPDQDCAQWHRPGQAPGSGSQQGRDPRLFQPVGWRKRARGSSLHCQPGRSEQSPRSRFKSWRYNSSQCSPSPSLVVPKKKTESPALTLAFRQASEFSLRCLLDLALAAEKGAHSLG